MEAPTIFGICGVIALLTLTIINLFMTKNKPFSSRWFLDLISIIPNEYDDK